MELSDFGERFAKNAGILSLMNDLGDALAQGNDGMIMMGGGNPAHIKAVQDVLRERMKNILENEKEFKRLIGIYNPPQGDKGFISSLAGLFRNRLGWNITEKNIVLTNGSQAAFFIIFNMLAGKFKDTLTRNILFPLAPEYIGYTDVGLTDDFFTAVKPDIEFLDDHMFKYHVNFDNLRLSDRIGAICVSRPTNPSGNVLTDREIERLDSLSRENGTPLIVDSAYGCPFPSIIFTEANPVWNENIILCMSLSKLGLPAARTGIVVAREEYIKAISNVNAIINLAPNSFGNMLAMDLVKNGTIIEMSRNVIRPFYEKRSKRAVEYAKQELDGCDYFIHKPEGSIFLWLWFRGLPITSLDLYTRLKNRGVLVVSGHYFFPGIREEWDHMHECIRVTYSQDEEGIRKGMKIIGEEVKKAYAE